MKQTRNIISIDAETNGLRGQAFAIAGIAYQDENEIGRFVGRCPIEGKVNNFVEENVLPEMKSIEVTHADYESLLKDFITWHNSYPQYLPWNNNIDTGYQTLWHMGSVVESKLFDDAYRQGLIGEMESPYLPIEVSSILSCKGYQPDSVDAYIKEAGLKIDDFEGGTHNPLYDAAVAAAVYLNIVNKEE